MLTTFSRAIRSKKRSKNEAFLNLELSSVVATGGPSINIDTILSHHQLPEEERNLFVALAVLHLEAGDCVEICLLYTSPSPRDRQKSRMPSSA